MPLRIATPQSGLIAPAISNVSSREQPVISLGPVSDARNISVISGDAPELAQPQNGLLASAQLAAPVIGSARSNMRSKSTNVHFQSGNGNGPLADPTGGSSEHPQPSFAAVSTSGITSLNHAIEHSAAALQPSIVVTAAPADAPVDSFQPTAAALSASDDTAVAAAHALGQVQRPEVGTDACSFQTSGVAPDPHSFSLDIIDNSGNDFVDAVDAFSEDVAIESLTLTMGNDHSVPIVACPAGGLVRTVHFAPTICIEAFMLPSHTLLQ